MSKPTTLFVRSGQPQGLRQRRARGGGTSDSAGVRRPIGTRQADIDKLVAGLHSKARISCSRTRPARRVTGSTVPDCQGRGVLRRRALAHPQTPRQQGEDQPSGRARARPPATVPGISRASGCRASRTRHPGSLPGARRRTHHPQGRQAPAQVIPLAPRPAVHRTRHLERRPPPLSRTPSSARPHAQQISSRNRSMPSTSRSSAWLASSTSLLNSPLPGASSGHRRHPALRGVQWLVALTVIAELGDITRFDNPRPARRLRRVDPLRVLQRHHSPPGRHHQDRQRPRPAAPLSRGWPGPTCFPAKISEHIAGNGSEGLPSLSRTSRLEGPAPPVRSASGPRLARQHVNVKCHTPSPANSSPSCGAIARKGG